MDNEAQLAAVLAYEVGHVVARHSMKRLQAVYGYSRLMEVALGDKLGQTAQLMVDAAAGLILLLRTGIFTGFERTQEYGETLASLHWDRHIDPDGEWMGPRDWA